MENTVDLLSNRNESKLTMFLIGASFLMSLAALAGAIKADDLFYRYIDSQPVHKVYVPQPHQSWITAEIQIIPDRNIFNAAFGMLGFNLSYQVNATYSGLFYEDGSLAGTNESDASSKQLFAGPTQTMKFHGATGNYDDLITLVLAEYRPTDL